MCVMGADKERNTPTFGRIIRERRIELGLTQEELAERVGDSVRQSDISRIERGYVSLPRRGRLEALAEALDLSPGYLLMQSGWMSEGDGLPFVDAGVEEEMAYHLPFSGENWHMKRGGPDAGAQSGQSASRLAGDRGQERTRRRRSQIDESALLSEAGQDVLAANRELTRAIQVLTAENRETQADRNRIRQVSGEDRQRGDALDVLNSELRAVIGQLSLRNEDLEARSLQLRDAAVSAENARFQLSAVMNAVGDVVVVDHTQSIILQSQSFADLMGDGTRAVQFLDPAGKPLEGRDPPLARAARGESFTASVQIVSARGDVQSYEAIGRPSGVVGGHGLGVLTLRRSGR